MAIPAPATKQYLDQPTDDPKLARGELTDLVDKFNLLLDHVDAEPKRCLAIRNVDKSLRARTP